ncbi:MAG: thioesterase family protein [Clostridiales bacterium]|nr:thioesterase family protein [Clostridiales bacterium]
MSQLKLGIQGKMHEEVTYEVSAVGIKSGGLPVYATPMMVALMERTAWSSVEPYMEEGMGTVGTYLDIKHVSASPMGSKILCESELVEIDGRKLVFDVKAYDDAGLIGEGKHERFIIQNEKFMRKIDDKLK